MRREISGGGAEEENGNSREGGWFVFQTERKVKLGGINRESEGEVREEGESVTSKKGPTRNWG